MIDWNRWNLYQQAMSPWHWGFVIVAVSVSIWLIVWLRSYFREDTDVADETLEMLTQFRELHREGGLSDDEFRLIRSRLASSVSETLVVLPKSPRAISEDLIPDNLEDSQRETFNQSPVSNATAENDEKSERMTDVPTE